MTNGQDLDFRVGGALCKKQSLYLAEQMASKLITLRAILFFIEVSLLLKYDTEFMS